MTWKSLEYLFQISIHSIISNSWVHNEIKKFPDSHHSYTIFLKEILHVNNYINIPDENITGLQEKKIQKIEQNILQKHEDNLHARNQVHEDGQDQRFVKRQ